MYPGAYHVETGWPHTKGAFLTDLKRSGDYLVHIYLVAKHEDAEWDVARRLIMEERQMTVREQPP